jgi:hypothetical protein
MNTNAKVSKGETGKARDDGKGMQGITMPKPLGHNVLTQSGRHATGQNLARVGNIRPGQSEPASNKVKTGVPAGAPIRSMVPRPSIPANQAETSKDLEARILAKPQPFTYDTLAATLPTDRLDMSTLGIPYNVMAPVDAKPQSYGKPVMSESDAFAAVGYAPGATKGTGSIISGSPTRGVERQAGRPGNKNTDTSSRDTARLRQTRGGF